MIDPPLVGMALWLRRLLPARAAVTRSPELEIARSILPPDLKTICQLEEVERLTHRLQEGEAVITDSEAVNLSFKSTDRNYFDSFGLVNDTLDTTVVVLKDVFDAITELRPNDRQLIEELRSRLSDRAAPVVIANAGLGSPQPTITLPKVPEKAPKLWAERSKDTPEQLAENAAQFIRRIYGDELVLSEQMHTGLLNRLDKALTMAYKKYLGDVAKGDAALEPGFPLPTSEEWKKANQPRLSPETVRLAKAQEQRDRRSR